MDLKVKLKQLLNRQGSLKSPTSPDQQFMALTSASAAPATSPDQNEQPENPSAVAVQSPTDDEILKSVENVYYEDESFDAMDYILQKLPETLERNVINADRKRLLQQLDVVSERVSNLIIQKQSSCIQELQTVYELQSNLQEALNVCRGTRGCLTDAMQQFTIASLGILSNYHKRQQLLGILKSLKMIKTLQQTDMRLRELLEEGNYSGAINLCLECQKAVSTFRYYKCISELSSKLQDTIEMIEEQLDEALSRVCSNFNTNNYEKLQMAYRRLGKTQTAMDQLHMHFTTAIHNTTFSIVLGYVELCAAKADMSFHKRTYPDLCKFITTESFTPCLVDLCKALWRIMHSYYRIIEWHKKYDGEGEDDVKTPEEQESSDLGLEPNFSRRYIQQKLEHGLGRIWQDVQQKVKAYLQASDLSTFKFDEFIHVLDLVNRLIDIGEEFHGSKSDDLHESIRRQSVNYFRNYHRACVEELRMFLENEGWELCPVKNNFTILQLAEFKFLQRFTFHQSSPVPGVKSAPISSPSHHRSPKKLLPENDFFLKYYEDGNPFDIRQNKDEDGEEILQGPNNDTDGRKAYDESESDDSDSARDGRSEFSGEQQQSTGEVPPLRHSKTGKTKFAAKGPQKPLLLTNTTLNVLRLFGKYMQMMNVLKPIAFDVVICMSQLFEYYMYAVYNFFATDLNGATEFTVSEKLRATIRRISDNLIYHENLLPNADPAGDYRQKDKVPKPNISPIINLSSAETLYGLAERVVAAESLVFLADQLQLLKPQLEMLIIPATKRNFLQQFYVYTVSMAAELRNPVYMAIAARAIDYKQVLNTMAIVRWDVTEIMSQHSPYVDILLREMQVFSMRLGEISKNVPIPIEAYNILWCHCIRLTNRTFVEGFASAKKCSNEGRALMQLDFQQFLMKLEKITDLRPIPDREYVEAYVKAFYLPENNLEEWVKSHNVG